MSLKPTYSDPELLIEELILSLQKAEEISAEREKSYLGLIENSPLGIFVISNDCIVDINISLLELLKYSKKEDLIGKNIADFIHFDFIEKFKEYLRDFQNSISEKSAQFNIKMLNCKSEIINVIFSCQKSNYIGRYVILLFILDLFQQHKTRESDDIFKTLYENAPDGIFITDADGKILDCNSEFSKQIKSEFSEIIGRETNDFIVEHSINQSAVEELQRKEKAELIVTQIDSKGIKTPIWRRMTALYDIDKKFRGAVVFNRDASDIVNAGRELEESNFEIKRQNENINASNEELRALNEELKTSNDALKESYAENEKMIRELRKSENKFRMIAENTCDYMFTFTVEENPKITYVSPSVIKMGYEPGKLINKELFRLLNKNEITIIKKIIKSEYLKLTDSSKEYEKFDEKMTLYIPDSVGKTHILISTISIFKDFGLIISSDNTEKIEDESIKRLQNLAIQVSRDNLLKMNKKLAKKEESYRNIYNSTNEGFFILELETGRVVDTNKVVNEIFGFQSKEILDTQIDGISIGISPYSSKEWFEYFRKAVGGEMQHFLWKSKRKNGEIFWTDYTLKRAGIGGENRVIAVVRDVDKDVRSQKALEESEEKFRQLTETSPTAIFIYQENKFVHVNPGTVRMTGYSEEELLKMDFWEVVHPDMREMVKNIGLQRQAGEDVPTRYEMKLLTKTGEEKWIDFNASRLIYKGKPAAIGNVIDITKTKNTVRELIHSKEKAEEADRLKSSFLANMSHEIRTPLNGILGFSQLLNDSDITEERKSRYIEIINKSGEQLLTIISDILDISKLEVGQLPIVIEKYSVNAVIDDIFLMFEDKAHSENKQFFFEKGLSDQESLIFTDEIRLKQILINLVSNALKFTKKGHIKYGYFFKGEFLDFFVEDTGMGIPKEKQEIIFERFRQSGENMARDFGGTGLGLSICRGITDLLGGKIWVESDGISGSCFHFTIPYKSIDNV
jgi:PAS domain S-box-containing protein